MTPQSGRIWNRIDAAISQHERDKMIFAIQAEMRRKREQRLRFALIATAAAVISALILTSAYAGERGQEVFRDASGRTIGTATRDSQGTTTFRDSRGVTTGTASPGPSGTTTFRDAGGRTTGTTTAPLGGRR
jgi:hypothetical protein